MAELDVRPMPKRERHPAIFAAYDALAPGESFTLVNDHDPVPLRQDFDREHPGSHTWAYLERGPLWRIAITKLTSTPLPRVLVDTHRLDDDADASGAVFKLEMGRRDLDSNIIRLPPGESIGAHTGPDLDVLIMVLAGSGTLGTERDPVDLRAGELVWLPRGSRRAFTAGDEGLTYFTVHQRRQSLQLLAP